MPKRESPPVHSFGLNQWKISRLRAIGIIGVDSRNLKPHLILESSGSCLMVLQLVLEDFWTYNTLRIDWPGVHVTLHAGRFLLTVNQRFISLSLPPMVLF